MKAMVLNEIGEMKSRPAPLKLEQIPEPTPGEGEVLIKVAACGVCHTELDEIEGRTPPPELPVILGHQVVGTVEQVGSVNGVQRLPTLEDNSSIQSLVPFGDDKTLDSLSKMSLDDFGWL
jgi:D-arabinose 1-dehydrogenase-like Zn-dependent alcohol dehydrogenase